jgi:hypothetical protein
VWFRALSRPALVAIVLGATVSILCTGILTSGLWLGSTVCWAFVPALQALIGVAVLRQPGRQSVPAFIEELFSTHRPWTAWYLAIAAAALVYPRLGPTIIEITALVPLAFTAARLLDLCTSRLGMDRRTAWRRVLAHQFVTYSIVLVYIQMASALAPRAIALFQR